MFWEDVKGFKVVHSVREFDEDDADVVCHGEEHFSEVFYVALEASVLDVSEFGDAFYHVCDVFAEEDDDIVKVYAGVFYDVVEETGDDDFCGELEIGEFAGGCNRMLEIWLAGETHLAFMGFL